jgi:hypothetical protein
MSVDPEWAPEGRRRSRRRASRSWALPAGLGALWLAGSCRFPDYGFDAPLNTGGDAGAASGSSGGGSGGSSGGGSDGSGGDGSGGASGTAGTGGESGSGGGGQAGVSGNGGTPAGNGGQSGSAGAGGSGGELPECARPRVGPPATCFDGSLGQDETNVDCGGGTCQPCSKGACSVSEDCLTTCVSGMCGVELRVDYQAVNMNALTQTPQFNLRLVYVSGSGPQPLDDLSMRYYLRRDGAFEPIFVRATQALVRQGSIDFPLGASEVSWSVVKVAPSTGDAFDAYIEVKTQVGRMLSPGDYLQVYAELYGGNGGLFDQRTHFSFAQTPSGYVESLKVTIHRGDELVWGYEPRGGGQPSCFERAYNFNGGELTIDGERWEAGAGVTSNGTGISSQSSMLTPAVADSARADMLRSSYQLTPGQEVTVPIDNGTYLVNVYAWSGANGVETGRLLLEGMARQTFKSDLIDNGRTWAALGPYIVSVSDGALNLGVSGDSANVLRLSGIELRRPVAP